MRPPHDRFIQTGRLIGVVALALALGASGTAQAGDDWPTYGHDSGGQRHSSLDQITPANVGQLKPAWVYHMRPQNLAAPSAEPSAAEAAQRRTEGAGPYRRRASRFSQSEATPLVVGGRMYVSTPYHKVVALSADTGQEIWSYDTPNGAQASLRGVEYWPGAAGEGAEILFGTRDGLLIALDAQTGKPVPGFGKDGVIDLKTPDVMNGDNGRMYGMTSPPIVAGRLVITGSATQEFPQLGAYGDVRAFDVRTGRLVWTFHTTPRPGEFGADTWEPGSWKARSGDNAWGFMTVDVKRNMVFMALGAPTWDRYGADRKGANLFSTSIVALDAATGRRKWHFQVVHHDIWDMDAEAPPTLIDVKRAGRVTPAVAVVSKSGLFFLLDRITGKPIDPVVERPVPVSDAPGEQSSPTQPFPVVTPPFARQSFSMDEIAKVTPELEAYCRNWITSANMKFGGPYTPLGFNRPTINFPGRQGGANWGGGSFDPGLGYYFVNANNLGQVEMLTQDADGHMKMGGGSGPGGRFSNPDTKLMCQQPPWGLLTAIDVSTGKIAWQSTLGVSDNVPPEVSATGRPNIGGSISTAGGLVFIGATDDSRFRAFDSRTGKEIWTWKLDASAHATPISYQSGDGRQMVAVVATGGSFLDSPVTSDEIVAFALAGQGR